MAKALAANLDVGEIKKKTLGGAASFFLRTLLLNVIGLAANLILGGELTLRDFAVYGIVTQIIGVLTFFSDVGLASSLIQQQKPPSKKDYATVFWLQMSLAIFIVLCCVAVVKSGVYASQLQGEGEWLLYALACSFVIGTLKTVPSIKLTRELNFAKFVIPQILEQLVFNGLLIILVINGWGLKAYTWAIWARTLIGTAAMLYLVPFWPGVNFSLASLRCSLQFGVKFQFNDLLSRLKDQFFYLFVAMQLPPEQFGLISFSKNWSMYPYNLTVQNIMAITFPTFSRLQDNPGLLRRALEKTIYFITLVIFPLLVGMCLFFYPLTQVIGKYQKWESALLSFVCFTLSIAPAAISSPLTNILNAVGKINQTLKLMIFWTLLTWLLTPFLMRFYGFNGVAIASLLISLTSGATVVMVKKYLPFSLWPQVKVPLLGSLFMVAFALTLQSVWRESLPAALVGGGLTLLVYFLAVIIFGRRQLCLELASLLSKGKS